MTTLRPTTAYVWLSVLLASCAGCLHIEPIRVSQLERGYVLMLPGIESSAWHFAGTTQGLRDAGIDQAVDIVEWGDHPFGSIRNLTNLPLNRERAKRIAGRIDAYARDYPDRPITVVGYSGGGGIAVLVTESLGDDMQVDRVILLGAAISPGYDLGPVLSRCRGEVVNFYSPGDWLTLGLGTKLMGTIDREKTESAGHVGFHDADGELLATDGLTQIVWTEQWYSVGHDGGHLGWLSRRWARDVLAPMIDPSLAAQ